MAYHREDEKNKSVTGVLNIMVALIFLGLIAILFTAAPEVFGALLMIIIPLCLIIYGVEKSLSVIFRALWGGEDC